MIPRNCSNNTAGKGHIEWNNLLQEVLQDTLREVIYRGTVHQIVIHFTKQKYYDNQMIKMRDFNWTIHLNVYAERAYSLHHQHAACIFCMMLEKAQNKLHRWNQKGFIKIWYSVSLLKEKADGKELISQKDMLII